MAKSRKKQAKQKKTVTVRFAVYVNNNGDGSASPLFFATKKQAEVAAEPDGERFCDDIKSYKFEVDPATGKILSGLYEPETDD